jgi:hypothetical protein
VTIFFFITFFFEYSFKKERDASISFQTTSMFSIMPYSKEFGSLAAAANIIAYSFLVAASAVSAAVVGFLLMGVYDRCSWNRSSGNVKCLFQWNTFLNEM